MKILTLGHRTSVIPARADILGNLLAWRQPQTASRVRGYTLKLRLALSPASAPATFMHGAEAGPVNLVRPYVLNDLHRLQRCRERRAARPRSSLVVPSAIGYQQHNEGVLAA